MPEGPKTPHRRAPEVKAELSHEPASRGRATIHTRLLVMWNHEGMPKVTLAIDDGTLQAARRYAQARGMSLSSLVRELLRRAGQPPCYLSAEQQNEKEN